MFFLFFVYEIWLNVGFCITIFWRSIVVIRLFLSKNDKHDVIMKKKMKEDEGDDYMKQEVLAKWLKMIIVGVSICILIVYAYVTPAFGGDLVYNAYPEFLSWYKPWMLFIIGTAIPIALALVCCWRIASEIGKDNSFSYVNAKMLKRIAVLAITDASYFFIGNVVLLLVNKNHPGVLLLALMLAFAGVAIAVAFFALSHLVTKATEIKEENELTI